jgi:ABC-type phosphate transport system substrate-binding protein
MRRRRLLGFGGGAVLALLHPGRLAHAAEPAYRVVIHPSNATRSASNDWLSDAFLKKVTRWPDGEGVRPVDQRATSEVRRAFSQGVLRRSLGAVRSYWQQRIFSGRDVPPPELDSDEAVVSFVAKHAGAVGYVSGGAKLVGVRELMVD